MGVQAQLLSTSPSTTMTHISHVGGSLTHTHTSNTCPSPRQCSLSQHCHMPLDGVADQCVEAFFNSLSHSHASWMGQLIKHVLGVYVVALKQHICPS